MDLMRRSALVLAMLAGWLNPCTSVALGQGRALKFTGDRLPEPPRQREAWAIPKTDLPPALIAATNALFDLGMADPRGCEYHEVDVPVHSLDGGHYLTSTRGWLLPAEGPDVRFAVCWDGLVRPVGRVGVQADLADDVLHAIAADEVEFDGRNDQHRHELRTFSPTGQLSERDAVSHQAILPLRACLLLRLGEQELAGKLWGRWAAGLRKVNNNQEYIEKPYVILAENWTWYQLARALSAHVSGDDRIALLGARALAEVQGRASAMAVTLGVQRYTTEAARGTVRVEGPNVIRSFQTYHTGIERPIFVTESPGLRPLLADQERRAVETAAIAGRPEGAARVAALIRDLQELSAPQATIPGDPTLADAPPVKALIALGDVAVEPLLDAMENDGRLTRTLTSWRDYTSECPLAVAEVASVALAAILDDEPFGDAAPDPNLEGRARLVAGARACWARARGVPVEGRWYRTLADDTASPDRWLRAAVHLVEPSAAGVLRGEPLRGKAGPSVAELLARRVEDLGRRPAAPGDFPGAATRMALLLARWDGEASLPTLRARMARLRDGLADQRSKPAGADPSPIPGEDLGESIATLTLERARGGDRDAIADYAKWLRSTPAKALADSMPAAFSPLWAHRDDPAIIAATSWLLDDPQSPWAGRLRSAPDEMSGLVTSPLLGVAAFRAKVLEALADTSRAGVVKLTASRTPAREPAAEPWHASVLITLNSGGRRGTWALVREPLGIEPGEETPFRVCDYQARTLSWIGGFPRCELFWPRDRRNEAVAACSALLRKYGERIQPLDERIRDPRDRSSRPLASLTFPRLDRPATRDDVERGLAIFTLAGEGVARVVPLARLPRRADWSDSGDHASVVIWQAEEVHIDGAWRRFYGIVGPHLVSRVHSEDVAIEDDEGGGDGNRD